MPPFRPVKSKAQSRKLFVLAKQGKLSESEARGKTKAANFDRLPEHARSSSGSKRSVPASLKALRSMKR